MTPGRHQRSFRPLLLLLAAILAFVAGLNFILGSPVQGWVAALPNLDEPLLGALLLMLVLAIVPIVFLVSRGEDKGGR